MFVNRMDHSKRQIITDLLKEPGNDHCADCDAAIGMDNAWAAVLSYGILVCDHCKLVHIDHQNYKSSEEGDTNDNGIHGVLSAQFAHAWEEKDVAQIKANGNKRSNDKLLKNVPIWQCRPSPDDGIKLKEYWINYKYSGKAEEGSANPIVTTNKPFLRFQFIRRMPHGNSYYCCAVLQNDVLYLTSDKRNEEVPLECVETVIVNSKRIGHENGIQLTYRSNKKDGNNAAYIYLEHESMETVMTWVNLVLYTKYNLFKKKYPSMSDTNIAKVLNCGVVNESYINVTGRGLMYMSVSEARLGCFKHHLDDKPMFQIVVSEVMNLNASQYLDAVACFFDIDVDKIQNYAGWHSALELVLKTDKIASMPGSLFKENQQDGSDVRGSTSAPTSTVQNIQSANRVIACEIYNENRHTDKEDISEKKLKSYCDELGELLIKEAKDNCGVDQLLPNCEIRIAQVQISQSTLWTDEIGHKTSRKEITELINQPPKSDITAEKLFDEAKELASKLASQRQSFTDEDRNHYVETCGNFVSVVGQAGIGKTTLSKALLDRVTSDERLYGADFVFYLQFREINFKEKTNFLRFLTKKISASWINYKSIREAVLDRLAQSNRVCIIMDGFDEANLQYDMKSSEVVNLHDEATAKDFIRNLFCGNLFPKAKKLVTSRPRQLYNLPQELRPLFNVTILGLDKDAQKQICKDLCSNEDLVWNYIENHPDVSSYCFVPVNCILVMRCIEKLSDKTNCPMPTTLTNVLIVVLGLFSDEPQVSKHFKFTLTLLEVFAKLAQKAFSENKYFFNEYDLETAGLTEEQLTTFFVPVSGKNIHSFFSGRSPKYTYFSHFLWQELYVAIELMIFEDLNDFNKMTYKDFTSDRFENVSKFLFGLCNSTTCGYLFEEFTQNPQIRNKLLANVTGQAKLLKSMTLTNLPDLSVLNEESFLDFLRICNWVNEMHDDEFANEFAEKINENFLIEEGEMLPSDVVGFHYVLRNRSSPLSISIGSEEMYGIVRFVGDSCTRFLKELPKTIESSLITMRMLDISGNQVGDDGILSLSTCISRIEELHAWKCGFTAEGFKVLASKIKELPKPMRKLDISFNDVGYDAALSLSTCISRIEELDVEACGFTAEGCKVLASKIKELPKPMRKLNISSNPIGYDGAFSLSTCISRIEELDVHGCGFTAEGFKALASKIKELPKPMRMLNISLNQVGDDGIRSLSTCISRIEELRVINCGFTAEGFKALASKIKELPKPMRKLDISNNDLGYDGTLSLSTCISRIEELRVINCGFTAEGFKALASKIKELPKPMRKLDISGNPIGYDGAFSLSTCISRIEELDVADCRFTAEGFKALASKIKELPKPMRKLNISYNGLGYDKAHSLSTCISRIEELHVVKCRFTAEGFKVLASKIKELPKPMERLVVGSGSHLSSDEVEEIFSDVGDKLKSLEVSSVFGT